ncbi:MAG: MFS transporter [Enterobacteriaceae bacterium]
MKLETHVADIAEAEARRHTFYTLILSGGVTLHALNLYITITVMPSIVADIGGLNYYAWSTTLFIVASIAGAATTVRLLHNLGARKAYIVAATLFALGTLLCALASNMPFLLLGRIIQGLGGGFLYALAYALTRIVLPQHLWARVISLISAVFGITTLVGPTIGGVFAQYASWRFAFWSLLPFVILFILLAWSRLPDDKDSQSQSQALPLLQLLMLVLAVLSVSAGSISASLLWSAASLLGALLLIAAIAWRDARGRVRLLPAGSFSLTAPLGILYCTIALLMFSMQPEIYAPWMLQKLHGQSPLWAGYLTGLLSIGWTAATLLTARPLWQGKAPLLIMTGPILSLLGLLLLLIFLPQNSQGAWQIITPVCLGLTLIGFGIGLSWPNLVTRIYVNAKPEEQALATGAMTTVQLFALAFGAACAGMVVNMAGIADPGGIEGASRSAFWLMLSFILAPVIALFSSAQILKITRQ